VRSLLETAAFTAMRRYDYRDGGLGLPWPEKCGAATNKQQSIGKGIIAEAELMGRPDIAFRGIAYGGLGKSVSLSLTASRV